MATPNPPAAATPVGAPGSEPHDDDAFPAATGAAMALVGVGLGGYLTRLKFLAGYACSGTDFSGCNIGRFDCGAVMNSPWADFLGIPTSVFATAFYLVGTVLYVWFLARRNALYGQLRGAILGTAWLGLFASVAMFLYAKIELGKYCLYCVGLYVVSLGYFICAVRLSNLSLWGTVTWLVTHRWSAGPTLRAGASVAAFLLIAWVGQAAAYRWATRAHDNCPADLSGPSVKPLAEASETHLRAGPDSDSAYIAFIEILDPSCHVCKAQVRASEADPRCAPACGRGPSYPFPP